jgi:hypothetical protein
MNGTTMVALDNVKMKLSHKDLLLLIGILVAVIIALTTLVYREDATGTKQSATPQQKSNIDASPSVMVERLLSRIDFRLPW